MRLRSTKFNKILHQGENEMLKDVQLKAITLLLSGRKLGDIASELAISREMLWMWRAQGRRFYS